MRKQPGQFVAFLKLWPLWLLGAPVRMAYGFGHGPECPRRPSPVAEQLLLPAGGAT